MFYGLFCLFEGEAGGDDLFDVDLAAADETDGAGPGVSVTEEEFEGDFVGGEMHEGDLLEVGSDTDDKDETGGGGSIGGGLDGAFDARAFHGDGGLHVLLAFGNVFARSLGEDLADFGGQFERRLLGVDLVGECTRDDLLCELETVLDDIGDDDGCGTGCRGAEELDDTDGTSTCDEDGGTERDLSLERCLQGDRERLEQSDLLVRHVVRNLVQPSGRMLVVSLQSTILGRDRVEVDRRAKVVLSRSAVIAGSLEARNTRLNGNTVTGSDVVDTLSDSNDDSTGLVTQRTLVLDLPRSKTSVLPEVYVGTADTGGTHVDEGHTRTRSSRSRFDQFQLLL